MPYGNLQSKDIFCTNNETSKVISTFSEENEEIKNKIFEENLEHVRAFRHETKIH